MRARLYIILSSPTPVNSLAGTQPLWTIIHNGISVFFVTSSHLPRLFNLEFNIVAVLAAWSRIVVVVEGNHAIVRFRAGKKPYLH